MLKFSKKVEYAIISMLSMADREKGQLTTARELSEQYNIPQEVAGKVLQRLARHSLIDSVQGVKGGYQLAHAPQDVDLIQVITAVDGPIKLVGCADDTEQCTCEQLQKCNIRNPMTIVHGKLITFFRSISIRDLQTNDIHPGLPVNLVEG